MRRGLSSGSRKTRIETLIRPSLRSWALGLSSGSRKTRIETTAIGIDEALAFMSK